MKLNVYPLTVIACLSFALTSVAFAQFGGLERNGPGQGNMGAGYTEPHMMVIGSVDEPWQPFGAVLTQPTNNQDPAALGVNGIYIRGDMSPSVVGDYQGIALYYLKLQRVYAVSPDHDLTLAGNLPPILLSFFVVPFGTNIQGALAAGPVHQQYYTRGDQRVGVLGASQGAPMVQCHYGQPCATLQSVDLVFQVFGENFAEAFWIAHQNHPNGYTFYVTISAGSEISGETLFVKRAGPGLGWSKNLAHLDEGMYGVVPGVIGSSFYELPVAVLAGACFEGAGQNCIPQLSFGGEPSA